MIVLVGSVNVDLVYSVDHIVQPGETIHSSSMDINAGGKGSNQAVALARAGAKVQHIGKIGEDGQFIKDLESAAGVDVEKLEIGTTHSGRAIIQSCKSTGENAIILVPGANLNVSIPNLQKFDWLVLQNEINIDAAKNAINIAKSFGAKICLNPSPCPQNICDLFPFDLIDMLIMNLVEARIIANVDAPDVLQLLDVLMKKFTKLHISIITAGELGAYAAIREENCVIFVHAPLKRKVAVKDTTGAGDTFLGYFLANYTQGKPFEVCLAIANLASGLCCETRGAIPSIPERSQVEQLIQA